MHIAIIGAGISGMTLASKLSASHRVTVFEKSRGAGGRMATRRHGDLQFDHGAQFFTARTEAFQQFIAPMLQSGAVVEWQPQLTTLSLQESPYGRPWFEPHYVAVPGMTQLCKSLVQAPVTLVKETRISQLIRQGKHWQLLGDKGEKFGSMDWVLLTAPAPQTAQLLGDKNEQLKNVQYWPSLALMGACNDPMPAWDAAVIKNSKLEWLALNHSKPGREGHTALVAHANSQWAAENYDASEQDLINVLSKELQQLSGLSLSNTQLHRWRYAKVCEPLGNPYWMLPELNLAAAGDWCLGPRVEDAFSSALALAQYFE